MAAKIRFAKSSPEPRSTRLAWRLVPGLLACGLLAACVGATDQGSLPPDIPDPSALRTPSGALARYRGALARVPLTFEGFLLRGAILTDELVALPTYLGQSGTYTDWDSRNILSSADDNAEAAYDSLHMLRGQVSEARGFLTAYTPDSSPALRAHMYALEGYAEIYLADLFCSGIPLSTVDFGGDFTLAAGSTTEEVYSHAAGLLDTAVALGSDSARIRHLGAIGRGRALLALGRYAEAATAVAGVPDDYAYQIAAPPIVIQSAQNQQLLTGLVSFGTQFRNLPGVPSVADVEGINGLDYRSSGDPRTKSQSLGAGPYGGQMYYPDPARFAQSGPVTYTIANGVEARLIEAEAALHAGSDSWLAILNALRTDGTYAIQPHADDPNQSDTTWHAGSGGIGGLRPLDDPTKAPARVDLLFRERAFWLYLTGHRQGDLRRLSRHYTRATSSIYPVGAYNGAGGSYGMEVTVPVPQSEVHLNPQYHGCFHRNA